MARQEQNLNAGGDEKLKINFMWPKLSIYNYIIFSNILAFDQ